MLMYLAVKFRRSIVSLKAFDFQVAIVIVSTKRKKGIVMKTKWQSRIIL